MSTDYKYECKTASQMKIFINSIYNYLKQYHKNTQTYSYESNLSDSLHAHHSGFPPERCIQRAEIIDPRSMKNKIKKFRQ